MGNLRLGRALARCLVVVPFLAAVLLTGCSDGSVRKMVTITSDPPCAKVWMNGVYRGETPVEIPINWNWFYDFKLEKEGYETYCIRERFYAPPQHVVPLDFFAEIQPFPSYEPQWRNYVLQPKHEL